MLHHNLWCCNSSPFFFRFGLSWDTVRDTVASVLSCNIPFSIFKFSVHRNLWCCNIPARLFPVTGAITVASVLSCNTPQLWFFLGAAHYNLQCCNVSVPPQTVTATRRSHHGCISCNTPCARLVVLLGRPA